MSATAPATTSPADRDAAADPQDDGGGRRFRASHGFVTVGVAVSMVAVLAGILFGSGNADQLVELLPGRAWLANDDRGSVTLVNGATGSPEFEMRFKDAAGSEFEIVQGDEGVFVVNRTTGAITRIDAANQTLGQSIAVNVADEPLFVIGGGRAYLVLKAIGTIQEIDPQSADLAPIGAPVELGAAVGSAVVDDSGLLAAAVLGTGTVTFVDGAQIAGQVAVNRPGDPLVVTLVGKRVVAIAQDLGKGEVAAKVLKPGGVERTQRIELPADGDIVVAPKMDGDQLWFLHATTATIAGVPLNGGDPRLLKLDFATGDDLGAPLPNGSFVYVPNFDQGALLKVDAQTGAFVDVVPVGDDTREFEAFVENGRVWGNDPVGGTAVVIDRDGNVQKVEKYQPGIPTNDGDGIPVPLELDQPLPGPDANRGTPDKTDPTGTTRGGTGDPTDDPNQDPGDPTGDPRGGADDPAISGPLVPVGPITGGPALPTDPAARQTPGSTPGPTLPTAPIIVPPAAAVPGAPGSVSAAAGDATATVSWLPALANGSPILEYVVTASTGGPPQTVDATTTSLDVGGLTNGTEVSFRVHAVNAIGAGPDATSDPITPMYAVPGAPTNVAFTLTNPQGYAAWITASWDLPVENPDAVADWQITCTTTGNPTPYQFTAAPSARSLVLSLPYDVPYFCGIQARAVDATPGPDVTMASGTTLQPFDAPPPPDGSCSSVVGSGTFRVQCNLTAPSGSHPVSGYIFEIYDSSGRIDQRMLGAGSQTVSSTVDIPTGTSVTIFYSAYWVDPVSGITVTSEPQGTTF